MPVNAAPFVTHLDNAVHHGGKRVIDPSLVIWHTSRGEQDARGVIDYLNSTVDKVASYHYVIDRTGEIIRMTDPALIAYHAGDSAWPNPKVGDGTEDCRPNGGASVNRNSIGICWAKTDHEDLTVQQRASGLWLAKYYCARYGLTPQQMRGHYEVSPGRKIDPGPAVDMEWWRSRVRDYITPGTV